MLITFIIALIAVGLMVLGLSITLIRKGRNMQGDVGDNDDMRDLGLECASAQARKEEAAFLGVECDSQLLGCSSGGCGTCSADNEEKPNAGCR